MSLSIGTIETYSTEFDQIQYGDLSTQDSNSLTLSDSNLWLVDSTSLDGLNTDEFNLDGSTSLYGDEDSYLSPISNTSMESTTGDIVVYGSDPNADNILYTSGSSLETSDDVSLLEVEGETQSGSTLISSGGELSSSETTSGEFTLTNSDSTTSGLNSSGSLALTDSGDPVDSSTTTETTVEANSVAGSDLALSADIQDVPFEMHSALGLLIIAAVIVVRRSQGWRRRQTITLN